MTRWATFDCYGTLVDWESGIGAELARVFGEERRGDSCRATTSWSPSCSGAARSPTGK